MNPIATNHMVKRHTSHCEGLAKMAGQELAAFLEAVTASYGRDLAESSAEDWLRELAAAPDLPTSTCAWRRITLKASVKLATRINISSISTASQAVA